MQPSVLRIHRLFDRFREEEATRVWFEHRRGGWLPADIVLRSPLNETETWYDPRGVALRRPLPPIDYALYWPGSPRRIVS